MIKDLFKILATQNQFAVVLLVTWMVTTYLLVSSLGCIGSPNEISELEKKLDEKLTQLRPLKQLIGNHLTTTKSLRVNVTKNSGPTPEYENLRRRIYSNTKELWHYLSNQLKENISKEQMTVILKEVADRKRSLLSDQEKLFALSGYEDWRRKEAASLSELVQRRLHFLQNPPNCRLARKLVCNLNKTGGFGCQLHHLVYCLILAYATERTLILHSKAWQFNRSGWETLFHPLSENCTSAYDDTVLNWPVPPNVKVVSVPIIEKIKPISKFLPPAVPEDLAHRIARFNGDASVWWVGQMVKYVLKPREFIQKVIDDAAAEVDFKSPIVGVYIRRHTKKKKVKYYHLSEYMVQVDDYYAKLALTTSVDERRVYLATDDFGVLQEARRDYPQYTFYGNLSTARPPPVDRPASKELISLLVDIQMLSYCHYLVTTFSSNVGRMVYELMQANRVDASGSVYSLDDMYMFCRIFALDRIAVMDHKGKDGENTFQVGDKLGVIPGRYKDGYYRGTNKKTLLSERIPWYKTEEHIITYPFPEYKQVPININTTPKNLNNSTFYLHHTDGKATKI